MRLVLIDGHALLHRAYHAYPPLTTSKGELVGAVYGFTNILLTVLKKLHPEYAAVAFDKKGPTFRHQQFEAYKRHRPKMAEELANQLPRVHEVVKALNIPIFEVEGYEADDVIGTLVCQAKVLQVKKSGKNKNKLEVIIVTGDQDTLQLVDKQVKVFMPSRGKQPDQIFDEMLVHLKYGLKPRQIVDLKALAGDASDGIPGVLGIGDKMAAKLIKAYGSLTEIYNHLEEINKGVAEKLRGNKETAFLSKELATINCQVPIILNLNDCFLKNYDKEKVMKLFEELEFKSLIKKLPENNWEEEVEEVFKEKTTTQKIKGGKQISLF